MPPLPDAAHIETDTLASDLRSFPPGSHAGVGVKASEERHAGRFLLALRVTGTSGGDAGCRIHLVRTH